MVERLFIVVMSASDDQSVVRTFQLGSHLFERGTDVTDDQTLGRGKTLATGVALAIVKDPDVEIDAGREFGDRLTDVAATDDQQRNPRQNGKIGDSLLGGRSTCKAIAGLKIGDK